MVSKEEKRKQRETERQLRLLGDMSKEEEIEKAKLSAAGIPSSEFFKVSDPPIAPGEEPKASTDTSTSAIAEKHDPAYILKKYKNAWADLEEYKGVYLEKWVLEAIEEIAEPIGRSARSQLINKILKNYVTWKGYKAPWEQDNKK